MSGFSLDLRQTVRSLRRSAALVSVVLLTIALGVGVNTAMFSVVNAVVLRPLPYDDPERLVSLWPEKRWGLAMLEDVRRRVKSYEATSASTQSTFMLLTDGQPEPVRVAVVSAGHFGVLRSTPTIGRGFTEADERGENGPVTVLSHGFWQRAFGSDPKIVGRTIRLAGSGSQQRTVIGVLPASFKALPGGSDAWVPHVTTEGRPGFFGGYGMRVVGRLKPGVSVERARAELRGLVKELTPMHPTQFRPIRYSPVDVVPLLDLMTRGVRTQLLVLLGAVGFILLIACTNVASLLLARAHSRQREVAIQMALGCSQGRVARQVLAESMLLALVGGTIGVSIAALSMPLIRSAIGDYVPRAEDITIDPMVLLFAAAATVVTAIVFGAAPAIHTSRGAPGDVIREAGGRGSSQGRAARRANSMFVVAEIALSLTLLVGAGLLLKSLWKLTHVNTGFDGTNVLTMQLALPPGRYDSLDAQLGLLRRIEERLRTAPGIASVAVIDFLPLTGGNGIPYRIAGQELPPGTSQVVNYRVVSPELFRTLRVALVRGRMLGTEDVPGDSLSEPALLANQAFAKLHWPNGDAIGGRVITVAGRPFGRIVGIVGDMRQNEMDASPAPEVYGTVTQAGWEGGSLLVRGTDGVPSRDAVMAVLRSLEPQLGVRDVRTMDEVVSAAMDDRRFYAKLLTGFAALALVLGLVGVYGVMTYAASRRTREFGVRLAFGATGRDLLVHVVARAMTPVIIGIGIGLGGATVLTRLLRNLLFEVEATDPWVMGVVVFLLLAAATAAALVPAARAAKLSPLEALRAE